MLRHYEHAINEEIQSISGWYMLDKEETIAYKGKTYFYAMGNGVVEASCCGVGGCRYAVVPGAVMEWKSGTNEVGLMTSLIEPIQDEQIREVLRVLISEKEGVSQVQFW